MPVEHAYGAHDAVPNSRLKIMDGCGQFPQLQQSAVLVGVLGDFVSRSTPLAGGTRPFQETLTAEI